MSFRKNLNGIYNELTEESITIKEFDPNVTFILLLVRNIISILTIVNFFIKVNISN